MMIDAELENLVERSKLDEPFNYEAPYIFKHYTKDKLTGVVAYKMVKDLKNEEFPCFIHVILAPEIRRTKEALKFIVSTFTQMKEKGFRQILAIIPHWKKYMIIFAIKFGFVKFNEDENYGYWVKIL